MNESKEIWTVDAETDPFKYGRVPVPFIWGAYNGSEYHVFYTTDEMVDFISEKDIIVYAHNGGKFDWHYVLHRLDEYSDLLVINGRVSKFKIGQAEFRDSYNILPVPLRAFNKDEFDYKILEKDERKNADNWRKIHEYLKNDCKFLWEFVTQFIDEYGLSLTVAGAALKTWRKISGQKLPVSDKAYYDDFKPYYYGGRVQCFEYGVIEEKFKAVDINSAYPFAMKHLHAYGTKYDTSSELPKVRTKIERCFITLKCISHGALPFRSEKTGALDFPDDNERRVYKVTGWEYLAGVETGTIHIVEILEVRQFYDSIRFDDYIDHFFTLKNEAKESGDKARYNFAKLFLNSLYGKFGACPEEYQEFHVVRPQHIEAGEEMYGGDFCGYVDKWAVITNPLPKEKHQYFNVATAASITGFVRAYLWRAVQKCGGVIYCDTDSIMCRDTGDLEIDANALGAWDIEADALRGGFGGKKLYVIEKEGKHSEDEKYKKASKGARLSPDELFEIAKGAKVTYYPDNPTYSIKTGVKFTPRTIQMR